MRIEEKEYLDFDDVLIKPKRTPLSSRSEVNLEREFTFLYSSKKVTCLPIIASNMDTVGTYDMARKMAEFNMFTALHKFYSVTNIKKKLDDNGLENVIFTAGLNEFQYLNDLSKITNLDIIQLDVANGYTEKFVKYTKQVREQFPDTIIIAGNVATPEATEALIFAGADIVSVGIGPGAQCLTRIKTGVGVPQLSAIIECFEPNSKVKIKGGDKRIADIKIGDYALTHKRRYKKITRIFKKNTNEKLLKVNGNISTDNHKYYVIEKKYINYVTDENIHNYAKWVEAKNLNSDFLLIKHARE